MNATTVNGTMANHTMTNHTMPQNSSLHIGGFVDPSFPNPHGAHDAPIIIYGYRPSFVLALLGIIIFAGSCVVHSYQVKKYRTWYFIPFAIGTALEVVGYGCRALSSSTNPVIIQVTKVD
jgi:hypothetical protein